MSGRLRILAIAPYEEMKAQFNQLAKLYHQIELSVFVGDLKMGAEIARTNFHANFDIIISRGGTAKMIQSIVPLPVIEIETSLYDILCAYKLSQTLGGRVAVVGFPNVTKNAHLLCDLMGFGVDIFTIEEASQAEPILRKLRDDGDCAVLCDMIANTTAKRLGLNAFLITSGSQSIQAAIDSAIRLCGSYAMLREENHFLRNVIRGHSGETVVFDTKGELFFSTLPENSEGESILKMLTPEIELTQDSSRRKILRNKKGTLYTIFAQRYGGSLNDYVAFYISSRKAPLLINKCGIYILTKKEIETNFYNSIYSVSPMPRMMQDIVDGFNREKSPIMVSGEAGAGKEQIINLLYLRSTAGEQPLIKIDCAQLNKKTWEFLMNHPSSPLGDDGDFMCFQNVDVLNKEMRRELITIIQEMEVCRRNRVVFSCTCQSGVSITEIGSEFVNKLGCLVLFVPPLRKHARSLPPTINLYLSRLNTGLSKPVAGIDEEGLKLMQNYSWPYNFTQLKRIVHELAITCQGPVVSHDEVKLLLDKERPTTHGALHGESGGNAMPIDLDRSLSEITRDIVCRVLEDANGNRSAAAKRLGISRTTCWRILQEQ